MTDKSIILALVIFLVILSVSTFFIFKGSDDPDEYNYNNFRVFKNPNIVGYTVVGYLGEQPYNLRIRNDPIKTENITISGEPRGLILSKPTVYLTMEPNLTAKSVIAALEVANIISRNLGIYNIETIGAITLPVENNPTTVATCANITKTENVILFRLANETKVSVDNNCILVEGTNEWEIIRASDRLVYAILELMW